MKASRLIRFSLPRARACVRKARRICIIDFRAARIFRVAMTRESGGARVRGISRVLMQTG